MNELVSNGDWVQIISDNFGYSPYGLKTGDICKVTYIGDLYWVSKNIDNDHRRNNHDLGFYNYIKINKKLFKLL